MKNVKNDLTGKRFGRLVVIGVDDRDTRKTYYNCQCDCGRVKSIRSDSLLSGAIRSCGCLKNEQDRTNLTANHSHKMSGTRIYTTWQNIKGRCYNKHDTNYYRYGGRGIKMCEEWRESFSAFYEWAIANGYREELTIDRIDNDGDYEPKNCRWANQQEQSRNRRSCVYLTIGNSKRTLTEWCEIFELDYKTVYARYKRNGFGGIDELFNK